MNHKYDIKEIVDLVLTAKDMEYPGMLIPALNNTGSFTQTNYPVDTTDGVKTHTDKGSQIRKKDLALGSYYFMPVWIDGVEIPNAVISLSQAKNIIKTQLPGRNGTVKEFISADDFVIELIATVIGDDEYPEAEVEKIQQLWERNEALKIESAITDMWLPDGGNVVLSDIVVEGVGGYEDVQVISMSLLSDINFELTIA